MTDPEREVLRPQAEAAMAELRRGPGWRPMDHQLRVVVEAVLYVVKYGVEWRALPADYPDWQAVYAFYERWNARGLPQKVVDRWRARWRARAGRKDLPTAASVQDPDGGHRLMALLRERLSTITLVWADGGYAGRLVVWARAVLPLSVAVVERTDDVAGFVVVPRRWVVERAFGWLSRYRRLVRDYERRPEHHEAMVLWATTIMTRQLAHQANDEPAHPRWGGECHAPPQPAQNQKAA
jgi:transposase